MKGKTQGMIHLNGHLLCAVDVETTGTDFAEHEIFQVGILPLNSNFEPLRTIEPFYINMKPWRLDNIDYRALKVTKKRLAQLLQFSFDPHSAMDMLEEWYYRLDLPVTAYQSKKIMPLWSNGSFDKTFLQKWLGIELYNHFFYFHERDTQTLALAINDRYYHHAEDIPFTRVGLSNLAAHFGIAQLNAHDALDDCVTTAEVYRKLMGMWMPVTHAEYRTNKPEN